MKISENLFTEYPSEIMPDGNAVWKMQMLMKIHELRNPIPH